MGVRQWVGRVTNRLECRGYLRGRNVHDAKATRFAVAKNKVWMALNDFRLLEIREGGERGDARSAKLYAHFLTLWIVVIRQNIAHPILMDVTP